MRDDDHHLRTARGQGRGGRSTDAARAPVTNATLPSKRRCISRTERLSLAAPYLLDLGDLHLGDSLRSTPITVDAGEGTTGQGSRRGPEYDQARNDDGDARSDGVRKCALCQRADGIREVERHHVDRKHARP